MNKRRVNKIEDKFNPKDYEKFLGYVVEGKHYLPEGYLIKVGLDPKEFKDPTTDFFLYGDNYKVVPEEEIIDREYLILIGLEE